MINSISVELDKEFYTAIQLPKLGNEIIFCGAYGFRHKKTGMYYVGGSGNLRERIIININTLKRNDHHNKFLQEAYNDSPEFDIKFWTTDTEEQAFDLEQYFLDKYHGTGVLFNIALDARCSAKGLEQRPWTDEEKKHRSELTLAQWEDPIAREKFRVSHLGSTMSEENKILKGIESKKRWEDPEYQKIMSESSKARWMNPDAREKHTAIMREYWNEDTRAKASEIMKKRMSSSEIKEIYRASTTRLWKDPEYRIKVINSMNSPEAVAKNSEKKKANWKNSEYRENQMTKRNTDEFRAKMSEKGKLQMSSPEARKFASDNAKLQWQAPGYREEKSIANIERWKNPEYLKKMEAAIEAKKVKISVKGVIYDSLKDTAEATKIAKGNLSKRARSDKEVYKDYFYLPKENTI